MAAVKVGIIGVGGIAGTHVPGWQASEHAELIGGSDISDDVLLGWDVGGDYVLSATGYGLTYAAIFLVLGMLVFERRDLT